MSSRRKTKSSEQQLKTVKRLKRFVTTIEVILGLLIVMMAVILFVPSVKTQVVKAMANITVTTRVYEILILMTTVSKLTNLNTIIQKNILIFYCLV
mgnify:CR=1 FL=1